MKNLKNSIPNLLTLSNLSCGIISLIMTFEGNYALASLFIIFAGIIDRYDGRIARILNVSSEIGKELDSLSDLVSFGVAPAVLIFNIYSLRNFGLMGFLPLLLFPIAGAYRLARYNISSFDGVFTGIPITIAGTFLALYALIPARKPLICNFGIILAFILSYLMISKLKLKKR